ncbi:glycosyltransferase family 2 protein [Psychrobacillus sp. L4]|uniref:glycosyltransferase family 2 protein n=1 Tax=Psychrobacillus sp. L4 TaxID=3236892 RepID=UPI0036F3B2AD
MNKQLISVICTVKNAEQTISETIDSVINQTYENWEMIIVDDGSTDKTKYILEEYSRLDKRIKPHFSPGPGRGKALNKAIELSSGYYVANLDADDVFHPQKLEIQINTFNSDKSLFIVATKSIIIYNNDKAAWKKVKSDHHNFHIIGNEILKKNVLNHSSTMMIKSKLDGIGRYNQGRQSQLDYELWLRAHNKSLIIMRLDIALTAKRIHSNQSFENKKRIKYLFNSSTLQLKYILLQKKYHLILLLPIRITLGLLPFHLRQKIRNQIKI